MRIKTPARWQDFSYPGATKDIVQLVFSKTTDAMIQLKLFPIMKQRHKIGRVNHENASWMVRWGLCNVWHCGKICPTFSSDFFTRGLNDVKLRGDCCTWNTPAQRG